VNKFDYRCLHLAHSYKHGLQHDNVVHRAGVRGCTESSGRWGLRCQWGLSINNDAVYVYVRLRWQAVRQRMHLCRVKWVDIGPQQLTGHTGRL
jgi:hypothetical protein